jgi:antitoxin (DNA-binding transcriptional repressor) of toxin-antitoxin stability system
MSEISATEASKRLADVLDAVEYRGETFTVVRRGRAIATIARAHRPPLSDLREFLAGNQPDPDWELDLKDLRRFIGSTDRGPVERLILDTGALIAREPDTVDPPDVLAGGTDGRALCRANSCQCGHAIRRMRGWTRAVQNRGNAQAAAGRNGLRSTLPH